MMTSDAASIILNACQAYVTVGVVSTLIFVVFFLDADPFAQGAYAFRPLIIPGLILLWPLVVARWAGWWLQSPGRPSGDATRHLIVWVCLAFIVPALLLYAAVERHARPLEPMTIRLSGPRGAP